jgi:precorrin-6A/cobalt-precorrin-6A reductase
MLPTSSLSTAREKLLVMRLKRILILGGTAEARQIAASLMALGHDVTSSLAGVTSHPLLPEGKMRVGGFGGAEGLRAYLQQNSTDVLVDATHPFAAIISRNAYEALEGTAAQLLRFEREAWTKVDGDNWISVAALSEAARILPSNAKVFVTTGRKELLQFLDRTDLSGVIRTVEPPAETLPLNWRVILDRPPHTLESELILFQNEAFTHVISKNAGGLATRSKLDAARQRGLSVVMIQRPFKPACETFNDVPSLIKRLGTSGCNV